MSMYSFPTNLNEIPKIRKNYQGLLFPKPKAKTPVIKCIENCGAGVRTNIPKRCKPCAYDHMMKMKTKFKGKKV